MTAPAYALIGYSVLIGAGLIGVWVWRARQPPPMQRRERVGHWIGLAAVASAIIVIPIVAKPGAQGGWTGLITILTSLGLGVAVRDVVSQQQRRSQRPPTRDAP